MPEWNEEYSRGMVVTAHPDDAEFGCSGTVAKWTAAGWDVVYVLCTDGSKGASDRTVTAEDTAKVRRREQMAAAKVLGLADVVFLDHPDAYLEPTLELRKEIAREIRRYKPDVLITMYPARALDGGFGFGHPDHMAAGEAAMAAVFPTARDHLTFPDLLEQGLEPHNVSEVWVMGHPEPDTWIDVTESIDVSIDALLQHTSQLSGSPEEIERFMKVGRRKRARGKGMRYAETFKRIVFDRRGAGRRTIDEDDEDDL